MGVKGLLVAVLTVLSGQLAGQEVSTAVDTIPFRTTFPDKLAFRLGWQSSANRFVVREEGGSSIRYRPANRNMLKLNAQFRAIDIGIGIAPAFLNPEQDSVNSRTRHVNIRIYPGKWMQTLDYYDQRGHFGELEDTEVYLPNLETRKIGGTTAYVFNDKFSFRSLISQNEWQRRSAGSFVPRFVFYYTRYKLELEESVSRTHSYDLGIGPGYHYNWVMHPNWMLSIGNTTGIGINFLNDDGDHSTSFLWESIFQGGMTFNTDRWFAGIQASYAFLEHSRVRDFRIDDRIYLIQVHLGYRIPAPGKWRAAADDVNRKFGWN